MWKKISASPVLLSLLSGLACVLAFPPIKVTGLLVLTPFLLLMAVERCRSAKQALWSGFLTSLVIMAGGFYWVIYVIHVFGHLPWIVATLLYLVFSGFGAVNFPLFTWALYQTHAKMPNLKRNPWWWVAGIPGLFVLLEFWVPKLFPWYVGHAYFESLWLNQIVELTGTSILTFLIFSWGGLIAARLLKIAGRKKFLQILSVPATLTVIALGFSLWRNLTPMPVGKTKRVALIQANIGSLEKVMARKGIANKLTYTIARYLELTEQTMHGESKPDLVLWPETAMPFSLHRDEGYAIFVRRAVQRWNVPLISGGYLAPEAPPLQDYNAAFLLEPTTDGTLRTDTYRKNILLAFGEYFPGGEDYPQVYEWFPQVSNFRRGRDQNIFTLADGTRLGVTICYEDISPSFFRKVAGQKVHAVVNLTNDSWFGPTSEPYQHAALAAFRAIETRTPFARVTNTGISFAVDRYGRMSRTTPVYDEGTLTLEMSLPVEPASTLYVRWGDWFIGALFLLLGIFFVRARNVPVPV